jgi:hypothetical protein
MYEDDGRSQAYRDGHHALTPFECATSAGAITVRIGEPRGDRAVIPAHRRYVLRVRAAVSAVRVDGASWPRTDATATTPGWWDDGQGFTWVRLPAQPTAEITLAGE